MYDVYDCDCDKCAWCDHVFDGDEAERIDAERIEAQAADFMTWTLIAQQSNDEIALAQLSASAQARARLAMVRDRLQAQFGGAK